MNLMDRIRAGAAAFLARETLPDRYPGNRRTIIITPRNTGGMLVTEDTAIQLSAVFACITVIAKALASSTWTVFEEQADGTRVFRRDTRLFELLNVAPNPEMTAFEFREAMLVSALLSHGGYAEISRDALNRPTALWPIHPLRVRAERDPTTRQLFYRISNEQGGDTILDPEDIYRIHGPSLDGLVGLEVAQIAARTFGHALATESFGAAFFGNGAQLGATLETEANLTEEQITQLEEQLAKHAGPLKSHLPLVLGGGVTYHQQAVEPEKAQFVETRQHLIEEVCRFFGVPPHKIAHLLRSTFTNIEHQGLEFVRDGLTPWAERLRQEADRKLRPVNIRRMRTRLDLDWLAEGDAKARAEADSKLVTAGIETRNEVRRRRGLDAHPDEAADKLTIQSSMVTLDRLGEIQPTQPAPEPPDEDEESDARQAEARLRQLQIIP